MFAALLLLAFGKMQEHFFTEQSRAWHWAAAYAVMTLLSAIGSGIAAAVFVAVLAGLYAWAYFALLRYWTDQLMLWLMTLLCGPLLPLVLAFQFAKQQTA